MAENYLFIDVHTKDAKKLTRRLNRLKNTVAADRGQYMFPGPTGYSMLMVVSDKTEEQMDNWLYNTKHGCDYVGCGKTEPFDIFDYLYED